MDSKSTHFCRNETRPECTKHVEAKPDEALSPFITAADSPDPQEIEICGRHWVGPALSEFKKRHPVARYNPENSDGQRVDVDCIAVPS